MGIEKARLILGESIHRTTEEATIAIIGKTEKILSQVIMPETVKTTLKITGQRLKSVNLF